MSGSVPLERRYRRRPACFPAGHRRTYGEEMIGVLLAAVALAGLPSLASAAGRRLIMLVAVIPLSGVAVTILTFAHVNFYTMSTPAAVLCELAPPVALAALTAAVFHSRHRRPVQPAEVTA